MEKEDPELLVSGGLPGVGLPPEVSSQECLKEHDKFGLDFLSKGHNLEGAK